MKMTVKHVYEEFSECVHESCIVVYENDETFNVLTVWSQIKKREQSIMFIAKYDKVLDSIRLSRHGAPKRIAADSKFCKEITEAFLSGHNINLREKPSRQSHKQEIAERNIGV